MAVIQALAFWSEGCESVEIITDCDHVWRHFSASDKWGDLANSDLWLELGRRKRGTNAAITCRWVPAHTTASELVQNKIDIPDFIGNHIADCYASLGAQQHQASQERVATLALCDSRTWLVLRRLLAVTAVCAELTPAPPRRARGVRQGCCKAPPLLRLALRAGHDVVSHTRGIWKCRRCLQAVPYRKVRAWIAQGPCVPVRPARQVRPVPVVGRVKIGEQTVHWTHHAVQFRGITWCWRCGCYAVRRLPELGTICRNPTRAGIQQCNRLRSERPPRSGMEWPWPPCEADAFPHEPSTALNT